MPNSESYYRDLLEKFIRDELAPDEIRELYAFVRKSPVKYKAMMELDEIKNLTEAYSSTNLGSLSDEASDKIKQRITSQIDWAKPSKVINFRRWYWVAASIIILLGLGIFFYTNNINREDKVIAELPKDVAAPTTNRAMITLADGSRVYLDSVGNGQLAQQGGIKLVKLANGQIAYENADGTITNEIQYNTLNNPRGSQVIDIRLSDGTHVWLNAGSSITYPVAFVGDERKVALAGEGYFEVAKDQSKKFIVTANGSTTEVLGTHFNVNAYEDEDKIKVTLLEGSVKTGIGVEFAVIKPGQQAAITSKVQVERVDVDQIMAWKNGKFDFGDGASLKDVMRQVARWYDVDVEYKDNINEMFGGTVTRQANLSALLERLELTGKVKFRIEGKRIIVNP